MELWYKTIRSATCLTYPDSSKDSPGPSSSSSLELSIMILRLPSFRPRLEIRPSCARLGSSPCGSGGEMSITTSTSLPSRETAGRTFGLEAGRKLTGSSGVSSPDSGAALEVESRLVALPRGAWTGAGLTERCGAFDGPEVGMICAGAPSLPAGGGFLKNACVTGKD